MKIAELEKKEDGYGLMRAMLRVPTLEVRNGAVWVRTSRGPEEALTFKQAMKLARALGVEEEVRAELEAQARAELEKARDSRARAAASYEAALKRSGDATVEAQRVLDRLES